MPLPLLNHSALALFAQRTRIPTSARSIGFCVIWVCISSRSSSANDWGKNPAAVAVLTKFALYWASLISLRAMQLEVELFSEIVVLLVDSSLPFLQCGPGNIRGAVVV